MALSSSSILSASLPVTVSTLLVAFVIYFFFRSNGRNKNLPPGPRPKPVVGNLLDLPDAAKAMEYYTQLGKQYGPICSLSVFGTTLIIVNDYDLTKQILEKRAQIYSDRPESQMLGEVLGAKNTLLFTQPGERLNTMRKIPHAQIGSIAAVSKWSQDVDIEIRRYLFRTLEEPTEFVENLRRQAATVVFRVLYGYEVPTHGPDAFVDLATGFSDIVIKTALPGEWPVDNMPFLKYVPEWFPGGGFHRPAKVWRQTIQDLLHKPFEFTKQQIAKGTAQRSVVGEILKGRERGDNDISDDVLACSAVSHVGGGADTTMSTMEVLFFAMLSHQDVLRRAQAEIDKVVGSDRFVEEKDRVNLPYTEAVMKEAIRWEPILEMNIPHCASADDEINGYFIPKGAIILANVWGLVNDEKLYKDPRVFNPDRFLGKQPELDPFQWVWGYGRRICPGRHLAYFTIWLQMARTLQVFDIKPIPGKMPKHAFTYGVVRRPLPFEADVKIRSPEHEKLVRYVEIEHPMVDAKTNA